MTRIRLNWSAVRAIWHHLRRHKVYRWGWRVREGTPEPIYKCFTCREVWP